MQMLPLGLPSPRSLAAALVLLSPLSLAQSPQDDFYQAYYQHHEAGDLKAAAKLYKSVLAGAKRGTPMAEKSTAALLEIHEDLFAADFSRLMPSDTIVYAELGRPGQQLRKLTEGLGMLAEGDKAGGMGISPRLFDSALAVRGAALAITEIDPNGGPPMGVLVLHPGDQDSLRGVIETALGNGAQPAAQIEGQTTWTIEGEVFVTQTRRLMIASPDRELIAGVVQRLYGKQSGSLADAQSLQNARRSGSDDLFFFHLRAEPIMPMIKALIQQESRRDREFGTAMAFMDIESLVSVSGRIGMDDRGLGVKLGLELAEGHRNLAFNLIRLPAIKGSTMEHIPEGVAFVIAGALNERAEVAPASGEKGRPIVTALDFGREFFANVVDVSVYGLPGENVGPIPDVALSVRVNNVERSRALWGFMLGMASQSYGGESMEPVVETIGEAQVERYTLEGVPVYVYSGKNELLITPSRGVLERTMKARAAKRSVLDDTLMGPAIRSLGKGTNIAVLASPGRLMQMAEAHIPQSEREQVYMVADLLSETVLSLGLRQTHTELALTLEVANLPDVSPLVAQLKERQRQQQRNRKHRHDSRMAVAQLAAPTATASATTRGSSRSSNRSDAKGKGRAKPSKDPRQAFESALARGDSKAASRSLKLLAKSLHNDATELNNLAWALLTEDAYSGEFTEHAMHMAERSNKLTEYSNWMFLDTLALAEFTTGNIGRAIELEERALEFVDGTGREKEVQKPLKKYKAAKRKKERVGAR